jgi:hypothetical protein
VSDLADAWSEVHASLPDGWTVGRPSGHPRLVLVGVFAVALLLSAGCDLIDPQSGPRDPGPAAAEQFVRDYVAALNTNDRGRLASVLGIPVDAPDVTARLSRYGGLGLRDVRIALRNEFPRIYQVDITATAGDGRSIALYEVIEWTPESRWFMGALPAAAPSPT